MVLVPSREDLYIVPTSVQNDSPLLEPTVLPIDQMRPSTTLQSHPEAVSSVESLPTCALLTWDGWPDGTFFYLFTQASFNETKKASLNWVCSSERSTRGDPKAQTWNRGCETRKRCLGCFMCESPRCLTPVCVPARADLDPSLVLKRHFCSCEACLRFISCNVVASIFKYSGGAMFFNRGQHTHPRYTHSLRKSRNGSVSIMEFLPLSPIALQGEINESCDEINEGWRGIEPKLRCTSRAGTEEEVHDEDSVDAELSVSDGNVQEYLDIDEAERLEMEQDPGANDSS
ncbi:unnamed protein product [Mycena citricolor]|uniref:Uncharacterized protein n=1 Tax=Mycena citricolor TaxID=2018698 RepID=A0AAD2HU37_9AGAR|nr:unnamed protein product [Mycena citricolor]